VNTTRREFLALLGAAGAAAAAPARLFAAPVKAEPFSFVFITDAHLQPELNGVVGTDMWVEIDQRFADLTGAEKGATFQKFSDTIALGRSQTPEDVANFVSYLASSDSDYMTGQSVLIDGGMVYR